MSQYEEISKAAQKWLAGRELSRQYMLQIVAGFIEHCEIPNDEIRFWQWNGAKGHEAKYKKQEDNSDSPDGAMVFDAADASWRLGVRMQFAFGHASVFFQLIVSERGGMPTVQVGAKGKSTQIDLRNPEECYKFNAGLVGQIKQRFGEGRRVPIGFIPLDRDAHEVNSET